MLKENEVVVDVLKDISKPLNTKGIVIYSDAGSRPNPGNTGWGAHGYMYESTPMDKGSGLPSQIITADGYYPSSVDAKTALTSVTPIKYFDFFGSNMAIGSNNSAEIDALTFALEELSKYDVSRILALTDSEYVRRGLEEWAPMWIKRNWIKSDGQPVPNSKHWLRLLAIVKVLKDKGIIVDIKWVKGHSDIHGNIISDLLATLGVVYSTKRILRCEFITSEAKGYWKVNVVYNKFLNFKHLYFNSVSNQNSPGLYYLAKPGNDETQVGKKTPDMSYAVVHLNKPDPIIESIRQRQCDVADDVNAIILLRLEKVFSPLAYPYLSTHGGSATIQTSKHNLSLSFLDDNPITVELNPAGLSLRAIEVFYMLELLLEAYRHPLEEPNLKYTITNVTNHFYDIETKDKKGVISYIYKLKTSFVTGFKSIIIPLSIQQPTGVIDVKIPLVLGLDLVSRNDLKHLETTNPKISLITWKESSNYIRYATIIHNTDGVGVWSNTFANALIIK